MGEGVSPRAGPFGSIAGTNPLPSTPSRKGRGSNLLMPHPYAAARCSTDCPGRRIARSASTSRSIIASVCSGVGVKRSRSSPRGTVG